MTDQTYHDPVEDALQTIVDLVAQVRREYQLARAFQTQVAPDGFPAVSGAAGKGAPTNEIDEEDGTPIPQRSDPTFAAVIARDEQRASTRRIAAQVYAARRSLDVAVGQARKTRHAIEDALPPATNSREWCSWHAELAPHLGDEPIHADGLCRFCYDWRAAVRADRKGLPARPPMRILELRAEGRRITTRTLAEVLQADRVKKRGKRGRRAA